MIFKYSFNTNSKLLETPPEKLWRLLSSENELRKVGDIFEKRSPKRDHGEARWDPTLDRVETPSDPESVISNEKTGFDLVFRSIELSEF